jgi:hypothetical protein
MMQRGVLLAYEESSCFMLLVLAIKSSTRRISSPFTPNSVTRNAWNFSIVCSRSYYFASIYVWLFIKCAYIKEWRTISMEMVQEYMGNNRSNIFTLKKHGHWFERKKEKSNFELNIFDELSGIVNHLSQNNSLWSLTHILVFHCFFWVDGEN